MGGFDYGMRRWYNDSGNYRRTVRNEGEIIIFKQTSEQDMAR
jgi:hypothetical protein